MPLMPLDIHSITRTRHVYTHPLVHPSNSPYSRTVRTTCIRTYNPTLINSQPPALLKVTDLLHTLPFQAAWPHLLQEAVGTSDPKHLVGMLAAGEHWAWFGMGINVVAKRGQEGLEETQPERAWEDLTLIPLLLF